MNRKVGDAVRVEQVMLLSLLQIGLSSCVDEGARTSGEPGGGTTSTTTAGLTPDPRGERVALTMDVATVVWVQIEPPLRPQLNASFCRFPGAFAWAYRVAQEGPCRLLEWPGTPPTDTVNLDAGEIVVEVAGMTVPLAAPDPAWPCHREPVMPLPPLVPGDLVRVRSTGGADIPAFDLALAVPSPSRLSDLAEGSELLAGDAWDLSVTSQPAATTLLEIYGPGQDAAPPTLLSCRGEGLSAVHLSPGVTALWPTTRPRASIRAGADVEMSAGSGGPKLRITHWESAAGVDASVVRSVL